MITKEALSELPERASDLVLYLSQCVELRRLELLTPSMRIALNGPFHRLRSAVSAAHRPLCGIKWNLLEPSGWA